MVWYVLRHMLTTPTKRYCTCKAVIYNLVSRRLYDGYWRYHCTLPFISGASHHTHGIWMSSSLLLRSDALSPWPVVNTRPQTVKRNLEICGLRTVTMYQRTSWRHAQPPNMWTLSLSDLHG